MILIFKFESAYQKFLVSAFWILNPFKKIIIKTECQVHVHINQHALTILKNDKHMAEYRFFSNTINKINEGAVWADQDFKSSNHFYHPYKKKEDFTAEATPWILQWIITPTPYAAGTAEILTSPSFISAPHSIWYRT